MTQSELCRQVEKTAGITPATPRDFETLSAAVFGGTGKLLSPTTLKRIWGYLNEPTTPRRSTLDILARYCGWRDYEDFSSGNVPDIESGNVGTTRLQTENLEQGTRIRLLWAPARICDIEYLGDRRWRVIASEGTRLSSGDTFTCPIILNGEPLYLDNLIHDGHQCGVYVCGRRTGINFILMTEN